MVNTFETLYKLNVTEAQRRLRTINRELRANERLVERPQRFRIDTRGAMRDVRRLETQVRNLQTRLLETQRIGAGLTGRGGVSGVAGGRAPRTGGAYGGPGNNRTVLSGVGGGLFALGGVLGTSSVARLFATAEREAALVENLFVGVNNQAEELIQNVRELGAERGFLPDESIQTSFSIVSGGITGASEALEVFNQGSRLAVANNSDLAQTTNLLIGTTNAYGDTLEQTAQRAEAFHIAARLGRTNLQALGRELPGTIAVAGQLNIELNQLLATYSGLTTVLPSNDVAIGLENLINAIIRPPREAQAILEDLGINLLELLGERGFIGFLREISTYDDDILFRIFGNKSTVTTLVALRGQLGLIDDNYRTIQEGTGELEEAFENLNNTLGQSAGSVLAGVIRRFTDFLEGPGAGITEWLRELAGSEERLTIFTTAVGALALALTGAVLARGIGFVIGAFTDMIALIPLARNAMVSFATYVGGASFAASLASATKLLLALTAPLAFLAGVGALDAVFGPSGLENINTNLGNAGLPQINEGVTLSPEVTESLVRDTAELLRIQDRFAQGSEFAGDNARRLVLSNELRATVAALNMNTRATQENTTETATQTAEFGITEPTVIPRPGAGFLEATGFDSGEAFSRMVDFNIRRGEEVDRIARDLVRVEEDALERRRELTDEFFDPLEDALSRFVEEGRFSFRMLGDSLATDFGQRALQNIRRILQDALIGDSSGSSGLFTTLLTSGFSALIGGGPTPGTGASSGALGAGAQRLATAHDGADFVIPGRGERRVEFLGLGGERVMVQTEEQQRRGSNQTPVNVIVNYDSRATDQQLNSPRGRDTLVNIYEQNSRRLNPR